MKQINIILKTLAAGSSNLNISYYNDYNTNFGLVKYTESNGDPPFRINLNSNPVATFDIVTILNRWDNRFISESFDINSSGDRFRLILKHQLSQGIVLPFEPFSATHTQSQGIIDSAMRQVFLQQFISPSVGKYTHITLLGSASNDNTNYSWRY